jgi:type IVB pilus formation R64 PilN family outer membrane protein
MSPRRGALGALLIAGLVLAGCTTPQHKRANEGRKEVAALQRKAADRPAAVAAGTPETPSYVQNSTAFITRARVGQAQRVREEQALPQSFEEPLAMLMGPGQVSLAKVIRELEQEMRIPVRVLPDVYELTDLPARRDSAATPSTQPPAPSGPTPFGSGGAFGAAGVPAAAGIREAAVPNFELNVTGTRREVLDVIAAKAGIEWEYVDRQVVFSRLLTKTFTLEGSPRSIRSADTLSAVGGASGAGGSSTTSSSASNEFSMRSNIDPLADLEEQLAAIRSARGKISISRANNTVLVRDVRAVVDDAATIVDRFNSLMSRQVVIDLEVISFTADNRDSFGFDLTLILQRMAGGQPKSLLQITPPPNFNASDTGVISWTVLPGQSSTAAGSQALVNALSQIGAARVVHKGVKATRNNVPAEFQNLRDRSYLAEVTSTAVGETSSVGLRQQVVTTGFLSKVYPTVLSGNRILLDGVLSLSNLDRLVTATSGDLSVQSPEVSRINAPFHSIVRSGDYVAFQAFERDADTGLKQSVDPVGVLGFQTNGTTATERFIVVMKATILGGQ